MVGAKMLQSFTCILNKDVLVELNQSQVAGESLLTIRENGELSEIKELTIKGVPSNSIAFTLDFSTKGKSRSNGGDFSQLSSYFDKSNGDGLNKSCDLVIISEDNNKYNILVFDLKSKDPDIEKANLQLENSKVFIMYMIEVIRLIYGKTVPESDICFRKAIATTRVIKKTINPSYCNVRENDRRSKLKLYGMNEISVKKTEKIDKGWLNYRGIIAY